MTKRDSKGRFAKKSSGLNSPLKVRKPPHPKDAGTRPSGKTEFDTTTSQTYHDGSEIVPTEVDVPWAFDISEFVVTPTDESKIIEIREEIKNLNAMVKEYATPWYIKLWRWTF